MAEVLKRAPREFLDSIPRDEFGDIHPTPEQQQEIRRLAAELMEKAKSATKAQLEDSIAVVA